MMISYAEAASLIGIKVSTLRSMVHRRQVPHVRLGPKLVVFDVATLDKWLPELNERIARTMQLDLDESKRGRDLYVVFCSVTRLCKIGRSNDARDRMREIQVGSPTRLILWCHAPLLGKLEPKLHSAFSDFRMHGEWFSRELTERIAAEVPSGDVEAFARFAESVKPKPVRAIPTFEWRGKRRRDR